jgi:nicotinate dehydrogenase subunit A
MTDKLALSVNGSNCEVSVPPQTPLLYVLRNHLKLTGARLGCGLAQCGACAVLVDGKEVVRASRP